MSRICEKPWRNLIVWATGYVCFCCEGEAIGNISLSSVEEIWNNSKAQAIRSGIIEGGEKLHPMCKNCPWVKDYKYITS
ncbi:MAG: SPASM domain-containing protein [Nanoarchaeota archaeon]